MYATIDIETTGLNRYKDSITFIGVGISKNIGEDFIKTYIFNMNEDKDLPEFKKVCDKLRQKRVKTVFQNGKFDALFIEVKYGIKLPIHEDVMLLATAYDLAAEHGLKSMAQRYLGVPDWDISKKEKLSGKDSIIPYLEKDVLYTWKLFCFFCEVMTLQQMKIYDKILRPAYLMYRDTERNGAYIDVPKLREVRKKYKDIEKEKLNWLNSKYNINWNSSGQVADVLFKEEGCPVLKKSAKTGKPSADAEVLNKLAAKGYDIPKVLLEYKAANTLNKMFLNRWEDDLGSDKRIHPSFNLTNVVTGRTSCLVGGTQILVPNGTKNIEDIVSGDLVFSKSDDGTTTISKVTWSGCTGIRDDLYKITYKTQGKHQFMYIIATSEHLIHTVESGYVRADSLKVGDRLTALHKGIKSGRPYLYATGQETIAEHIVIYKSIHGYLPEHIHHADFNKLNNEPANLIGMTSKEHTSLHAKILATPEKMKKAGLNSHNEKWQKSMQKTYEAKLSSMPKEVLIDALIRGNGIVGAAKILHRDYTYIYNRMKYWNIKYDGRKALNQRLVLNDNHYIINIEKISIPTKVYDITVENTHNFFANEICVHNCQNPNLQQVPRNKDVRGLFNAPEGKLFFEADYSQLELRIAAQYSRDPVMLDIYKHGGDIHSTTAKLMTGGREPTKEERGRAKAVNFGRP